MHDSNGHIHSLELTWDPQSNVIMNVPAARIMMGRQAYNMQNQPIMEPHEQHTRFSVNDQP